MLVCDLMSESVTTVAADVTLTAAVETMLREGIGSVVVTRDGSPAGICTETDAMYAGAATDRPFSEITLSEVASSPLVTAGPDETVRQAVRRMRTNDVKKLPVVDGMELAGIITMTDVVHSYASIVKQAQDVGADRDQWDQADDG